MVTPWRPPLLLPNSTAIPPKFSMIPIKPPVVAPSASQSGTQINSGSGNSATSTQAVLQKSTPSVTPCRILEGASFGLGAAGVIASGIARVTVVDPPVSTVANIVSGVTGALSFVLLFIQHVLCPIE